MHNSLKIVKTLLYYYFALHVSGTLAPIIRSLLILHIQPPVTVCRWVGCIFQLRCVAFATVVTDQSWKIQPTRRHTVTGGCMCRIGRLLMMGARVPETCRAEQEYNKVLMILRLLCTWLVLYSLLSSLMHGTMNLKSAVCSPNKAHSCVKQV